MSPHDHGPVPAHGRDKEADPEDPLRLEGAMVEGDPLVMLEGLVEEFARMGMPAMQIHGLFSDPNYRATYGLSDALGAEQVRERVDAVLARSGVWRVTLTESEVSTESETLTEFESQTEFETLTESKTHTCSGHCSTHDALGGLHND